MTKEKSIALNPDCNLNVGLGCLPSTETLNCLFLPGVASEVLWAE